MTTSFGKFDSLHLGNRLSVQLWQRIKSPWRVSAPEPPQSSQAGILGRGRGAAREPGLLVSAISDTFPFEGYKGERKITERKILRNVFKEGDMFFNTGDLMMVDKDYYVYFIDRLGDTYRWKGENVATTEVAEVLHDIEEIQEANVYGVTVPGHDGRAGMAAVVLHPGHRANLRDWYSHVALRLPVYARPLFLRLTRDLDHTGTFKQTKAELVREGFDPSVVTDSLYFRDDSKETYVPLDLEVYKSIVVGKAKL
ncbi:hypothetical protein Bbelb_040520 [Branchiostoma belcheri]|nr:hypothetical protein Bbelb_040520 [Branchiostoma belcheri]